MIATLVASALMMSVSLYPRVPWVETDVPGLAPQGLLHQEVLRIDPDFGNNHHDIVVDSWQLADHPDSLLEVRMWWLHSKKNDERSPFGKGARRFVDLEYKHRAPDRFAIVLRSDRRHWSFDVVLRPDGTVVALTDIVTSTGQVIKRCEATEAKLIIRRVLGVPTGLKGLAVTCHDDEGKEHHGTLPEHKSKRRRSR